MTPESIKTVAHLLAGEEPGWQTRFAMLLGISRGYAHNLLTGERPMNQTIFVKMVKVARERAAHYRGNADALDEILGSMLMAELAAMPRMTKEEYERQADEAVDAINEKAFGATKGDDT